MGVREIDRFLEEWQMDARDLNRKLILAPTPRERERWHAIWLLAQGWTAAGHNGGKIFFADEAHFRADAELRGQWTLKGEPALVESTRPRHGERASYYSAVCLETGEVEWMELEGNSNGGTSAAFLMQLKEKHPGPLTVIWDNAPAHRGEAVREYLRPPGLGLRLVNLPGYSPDFNADEAVWGWARGLLALLQHPKTPPGPGLPDTGRGVQWRLGAIR